MRPLEPGFGNAVWHLRSLSARSSLGDLRSSLQVVPPRRRFWRLLARVVLVCFGVVPSLPWAISRAGSGRTGSSRRALHGPQNLLGIGDWLLLHGAYVRPLEPGFGNAVWHLRSLSARSSLGDLRSSLLVVPLRRRFWRLLARVVLVCFVVVSCLPWAIVSAGSGCTGSSRLALHGPQRLLGIGDWPLPLAACHAQAGTKGGMRN